MYQSLRIRHFRFATLVSSLFSELANNPRREQGDDTAQQHCHFQKVKIYFVFTGTRNGEIYYCRRDRAMTGLLSGVVLVLVLCHAPKTFLNIQVSFNK